MPHTTLPEALYRADQVRELDRLAIGDYGIPAATLMARAGQAAFDALRARFPRASKLAVICGPGNNGGDGYVLAKLAREQGYEPWVGTLGSLPDQGAAAAARMACMAAGVGVEPFDEQSLARADVIVDAMLGTGLERELKGGWRAAVETINRARCPVLAVDVPSGIHSDSGRVMGVAVRASVTVSVIGLKAGLFTGAGPEHRGEILFDDLGVPHEVHARLQAFARRLTGRALHGLLPRRARDAHKGDCGHVLVIGGDRGMPGAARLAGEAAYRAGSGLVTLAVHPANATTAGATRPELLAYGVRSAASLKPLSARATVIAIGPGLGRGAFGRGLFKAALKTKLPLVVDADALFFLSGTKTKRKDWILTPHEGEAARLLGTTSTAVRRDRFAAARAIVKRHGGVCVLKGAGTIIADGSGFDVCDRGGPGMASGGMGDVLTGTIAALLAQGLAAPHAARLGVWAHATAGDEAARCGEIGLIASDLLPFLRASLNDLSSR